MKYYFKYLKYLLIHKFWVTHYCFQEKLYWRGIMHDINKFRLSSILPYAKYFYLKNGQGKLIRDATGYYDAAQTGDDSFDLAWLHHQHTNKHHWQYWCLPTTKSINNQPICRLLDMPEMYIIEMLCDWRGAGRTQGTNPDGGWKGIYDYYVKNRDHMYITANSRFLLESIITYRYQDENLPGWYNVTKPTKPN